MEVLTLDGNLLAEVSGRRAQALIGSRHNLQRGSILLFPFSTIGECYHTTLCLQRNDEAYLVTGHVCKVLYIYRGTGHTTGKDSLVDVVEIVTLNGHLVAGTQSFGRADRGNLNGFFEGQRGNRRCYGVGTYYEADFTSQRSIGHVDVDILVVGLVESTSFYGHFTSEHHFADRAKTGTRDAYLMGAKNGRWAEANNVDARLGIRIGIQVVFAAPCQ